MKQLLFIFLLSILFACDQPSNQLTDKLWLSVSSDDQLYSNTSTGLYFHSNGNLLIYTLGTDYFETASFTKEQSRLTINIRGISQSAEIIFEGEDELRLQFDTLYSMSYKSMTGNISQDKSLSLHNLLLSKSWVLNDEILLEFQSELGKSMIKPQLRNEVLDVTFHRKRDERYLEHGMAVWGVSYLHGINLLALGQVSDHFANQYILIEEISDSLIVGSRFNSVGKKMDVKLTSVHEAPSNQSLLIGKWQLTSYSEIPDEYSEQWHPYEDISFIQENDLINLSLRITFLPEGLFEFSTKDRLISSGAWKPTKSGEFVQLITEYGIDLRNTSYLTIIELDSSQLQIIKPEYLPADDFGYDIRHFKETYTKVNDN